MWNRAPFLIHYYTHVDVNSVASTTALEQFANDVALYHEVECIAEYSLLQVAFELQSDHASVEYSNLILQQMKLSLILTSI